MSHLKISELLQDRGQTHGNFQQQATTSQQLKDLVLGAVANGLGDHPSIDPAINEALEMICVKMSRIANGNPYELDHWRDISGYAQLVVDLLEQHANSSASEGRSTGTAPVYYNAGVAFPAHPSTAYQHREIIQSLFP